MNERNRDDTPPGTLGEALDYCHRRLERSDTFFGHGTDNAWDESVQLVLAVADLPPDADDSVLPHPLDQQALARLESLLRQRIQQHIPLPYLLGKAWFAGLEFLCDERAIIPRSPLAELILHDYRPWYGGPPPQRILDLCCGGGCIGLAASEYNSDTWVDLVDIDLDALALARENAEYRGLASRVEILRSDLFQALDNRRYDIILSNPPYVDARDLASMPAEYHHEPALALGSGTDGLDLTRRILQDAADFLEPSGLLVVEVGNSWEQLEAAYPDVPFTWLVFEQGGHGVFALTAEELQSYRESLAR